MSLLVTSDIHLNDAPLDEYRWGLLPWLAKEARAMKPEAVLILGDLTVAKDKHAAMLVNRLVDGMVDIAREAELIILKANHDYYDEEWPFFRFLDNESLNIRFVSKPLSLKLDKRDVLLLPHTRDHEKDWAEFTWDDYDLIFCHQTFDGAKAENGTELRGIPPDTFKGFRGQVWSGDIHVPQQVNKIVGYVGSPYRVHFGDKYEPRVLMLGLTRDSKPQQQDLEYPCLYRHVFDVATLAELEKAIKKEAKEGDQVKVRVQLRKSEFPAWPALRKEMVELVEAKKLVLCGMEPKVVAERQRITSRDVGVSKLSKPMEIFDEYADERDLGKGMRSVGKSYLKEAM